MNPDRIHSIYFLALAVLFIISIFIDANDELGLRDIVVVPLGYLILVALANVIVI